MDDLIFMKLCIFCFSTTGKRSMSTMFGCKTKKVPSLVDLCVQKIIDNVRYLGNVGETDAHLLDRILPHCTLDQLMHVEKSTEVRNSVLLVTSLLVMLDLL